MTARQAAWFLGAYVALVAVGIWFDLAVLCHGAAKYDGGCGGFGVYIPMWIIFLAPLPLAAIALEFWRRSAPVPNARLVAYLAGIVVLSQVGFLIIAKFPVLVAVEIVVIVLAAAVRWRAVRQA